MLARVSGREAEHPRPADGRLRRTFVPAIGCSVKTANDDGDCKQLSEQDPENEHGAQAPQAVTFSMIRGSRHYVLTRNRIVGSR